MAKIVEVARSYAYKLNCGNYESRDFFCSQKAECSPLQAEETSERLYRFCRAQVLAAVAEERKLMAEEAKKGRAA